MIHVEKQRLQRLQRLLCLLRLQHLEDLLHLRRLHADSRSPSDSSRLSDLGCCSDGGGSQHLGVCVSEAVRDSAMQHVLCCFAFHFSCHKHVTHHRQNDDRQI